MQMNSRTHKRWTLKLVGAFVATILAYGTVIPDAPAQDAPPKAFITVADWFYDSILRDVQGADQERQLVAKALYYNCVEAKEAAADVTAQTKAGIENVLEFGEKVLRLTLNKDYLQRADYYYRIAADAHGKNEFTEAIDCYMRSLYYNGEMWRSYDQLANTFLNPVSGFYSPKRAFLMARLGLLVKPREPSLHHSYVRSLLHLKQYTQALNAADRGMAISTWESAGWDSFKGDRGRCKLISRKAQALWALKEADNAKRYFIMATKIDKYKDVIWAASFLDGTRKVGELGFGVSEDVPGTGNLEVASKPWLQCTVSFLGETKIKDGDRIAFNSIPAGKYILEGWTKDQRVSAVVAVEPGVTCTYTIDFFNEVIVDLSADEQRRRQAFIRLIPEVEKSIKNGKHDQAEKQLLEAFGYMPGNSVALRLWGKERPLPIVAGAGRDPILVEKLNPAFVWKDELSFRWDVQANGAINDGTADAYDGGMLVQVNETGVSNSRFVYTLDRDELWLNPQKVADFEVSQRIFIDRRKGFCRWVHLITSSVNKPVMDVKVSFRINLGASPSQVLCVPGGETVIPDEVRSIVTNDGDNSRPATVHWICGSDAKKRPTVTLKDDNITYEYFCDFAAGETIGFMHVEAQRKTTAEAQEAQQALSVIDFSTTLDQYSAKCIRNWR